MARFAVVVFLCLAVSVRSGTSSGGDTMTLDTQLGRVKGSLLKSHLGRDFIGFTGIPFAQPPVGELRFQAPKPAGPWGSEVLDATKPTNACPQASFFADGFAGNEDCLVLNIYTPYIKEGTFLPVMVFIHGGGYVCGSGGIDFAGPKRFMDHDIILVTIQYRLGLLGFLNTEDNEATGNYGMLDQVLALRWIKENIDQFGGDKTKVTIFGVSAGGSAVSYHLVSPLSKGLFDGAIAQSGSTLTKWAFRRNPLEWAKNVSKAIGCPTDTTKKMVDCFRKKPAYDLVKGNNDLKLTGSLPFNAAPSVDSLAKHSFLPKDPLTLMQEGKVNNVPVIAGITADEGYFIYLDLIKFIDNKPEEFFGKYAGKYFPTILEVDPHMTAVFDRIKDEYFGDNDVSVEETFENTMSKVVGHILFDAGVAQTVDLLHKAGVPVRTYIYNHLSNATMVAAFGGKLAKYVSHGDDSMLQLNIDFVSEDTLSDNDWLMSKVINTIWVNFAYGRYDNLVTVDEKIVDWPLYAEQSPTYLDLSVRPSIKKGKICNKIDFWDKTIPKMVKEYRFKQEL